MEIHSYDDIKGFNGENWWYSSRRELLVRILQKYIKGKQPVVVDLGCGVGANAEVLRPIAASLVGVDPFPQALQYARNAGYDSCVDGSAENIPVQDASADLVLCADVLEHVHDVRAVGELNRILKTNGIAVITVPAFMSLWNENDDYSHHLRRYRKKQLVTLFTSNNFKVCYAHYWNRTFFFPVWLVARFYKKDEQKKKLENNLTHIPSWANGILRIWMKIETATLFYLGIPFGTSVVMVVKKM